MLQPHNRRSIRLKGYDYRQSGGYFITICTHDRLHWFGEIISDEMVMNTWGHLASDEWHQTENIRSNVILDAFVVMPNHVHGIIFIVNDDYDADGNKLDDNNPNANVQLGNVSAVGRGAMHCAPKGKSS